MAPPSFAESLREWRHLVPRHPDHNSDHKRSGLKPWLSVVGVKDSTMGAGKGADPQRDPFVLVGLSVQYPIFFSRADQPRPEAILLDRQGVEEIENLCETERNASLWGIQYGVSGLQS